MATYNKWYFLRYITSQNRAEKRSHNSTFDFKKKWEKFEKFLEQITVPGFYWEQTPKYKRGRIRQLLYLKQKYKSLDEFFTSLNSF